MLKSFSPIDFPSYSELTYKQMRPIMFYQGDAPVGAFAEVLRGTLSKREQRRFDMLSFTEIHLLVDNYVDLSMTREEVANELRNAHHHGDRPE